MQSHVREPFRKSFRRCSNMSAWFLTPLGTYRGLFFLLESTPWCSSGPSSSYPHKPLTPFQNEIGRSRRNNRGGLGQLPPEARRCCIKCRGRGSGRSKIGGALGGGLSNASRGLASTPTGQHGAAPDLERPSLVDS